MNDSAILRRPEGGAQPASAPRGAEPPPARWPRLLTRPALPLPAAGAPRRAAPIATGVDWTPGLLERFDRAISAHARRLGLDTYPIQYEIITASQMMDLCSTVGMPVHYAHWSFGKQLLAQEHDYRRGMSGLAYEIVINTSPSIAYLMETNTLALQVLVMAHAGYGHNAFFKNNYLFRQFTQADAILDYLQFARSYVQECETRHGWREVEAVLDTCHSLAPYGVDRYRRPHQLSARRERERQAERLRFAERHYNPDFAHLHMDEGKGDKPEADEAFEPQENLLYFLEKQAPRLAPWQRELVRIVRKVAQYFHPQAMTKVANEGAATFWHYTLLHELYDAGEVDDGFMLEWMADHGAVVAQPAFDDRRFQGMNPYALGFAIFRDIRRICEQPTDEDRHWFPDLAGSPWTEAIAFAMANFKDESLIEQYLSPRVMRQMRLFLMHDGERDRSHYAVSAIHNEAGYQRVRAALAAQYRPERHTPELVVARAGEDSGRALLLQHRVRQGRLLEAPSAQALLARVRSLWHFDVVLEEVDEEGRRLQVYRT
jgi:spore cortex formation protein SpoVR/YcgB (stage V sporulation)